MKAVYINQNGTGNGLWLEWFTCLSCGWQSVSCGATKEEAQDNAKKGRCFLCVSKNIKLRSADEKFFKSSSEELLKNKYNYMNYIKDTE